MKNCFKDWSQSNEYVQQHQTLFYLIEFVFPLYRHVFDMLRTQSFCLIIHRTLRANDKGKQLTLINDVRHNYNFQKIIQLI